MSVFFRTGENTAASVSWPVYVFLILPFQAMYLFLKVIFVGLKAFAVGAAVVMVFVAGKVRDWRADREEARPPTP